MIDARPEPPYDILNEFPDASYVLDGEARVLFVNGAAQGLLGYAPAEIVGRRAMELVGAQDACRVAALFEEFRGSRAPTTRQLLLLLRRRDGTRLLADTSVRFRRRPGGALRAYATFRPAPGGAAQLAALGQEGPIARFFDALPVGMALTDPQRRIVAVNTALSRMLGYSPEEMHGRVFDEFSHPDDVPRSASLALALRRGEMPSFQMQKRYLAKDGAVVWVNLHATAIRTPAGEGLHAIGMVEDITHFKQGEAELRQRLAEQRKALIRETHHRIKNSLQGIVGLLTQQAQSDPSVAMPLQLAIDRIQSVALVHGMCAAPGSEFPNCCEVTMAIATALKEQYARPVVWSVSGCASPVAIHSDELVPYALIVTELIANAIKHGTATSEPILLEVVREEAAVTVNVVSPAAQLPAGFDFERGIGVGTGLSLVKSLLPPRGLELSIFQSHQGVVSRVRLSPPIVAAGSSLVPCAGGAA